MASVPCIGVLALQGAYAAHQRRLEALSARTRLVRLPDQLDGLDGLVLPGGESTTLLHFLAQDDFLACLAAFARHHPCLGTCAGLILLARQVEPAQPSLGVLDVVVQRNAYGRQRDSAILAGPSVLPGPPLEMVFIRAPKIVHCGPQVEVLARRGADPVLVRQGTAIGCAFHPELGQDPRVHQLLLAACAEAGGRDAA